MGEGFQLDSSLIYHSGDNEGIEGDLDVVIPLWNGGRHVIFTQPGFVFWKGLEGEKRIDGNIGLVYRAELTRNLITGASVFYDHDFQIGHSRVGGGVDLQSGYFQLGANYYHPLGEEEDGREGFVEEALRGMDARLVFEREAVRLGSTVGYWEYDGGEDVEDEWRTSFGLDFGIRIFPGVFAEASWERHKGDVVLDERIFTGLAFRFSLPDFEGASYGSGERTSNLYKIVGREKRILYEEREATPPVRLAAPTDESGQPLAPNSAVEEGSTVTIAGELESLSEPVALNLVIDEDATSADLGDDFSYGHKVYTLDASTGRQSALGAAINCPNLTCAMMIPARVTRFDVEIEILNDDSTDPKELPEEIVLRIEVPEEYQQMVRSSETTTVAIQAHGNTVEFASAASMVSENGRTPEGMVAVSIGVDLPSPVPITLNVGATDDAATAMIGRDYMISTRSLRIPAGRPSASLTLTGIDNSVGGGNKTIELTLSGSLPEGWTLGTQTTHTVTLLDDDLAIGFANPGDGDTFNQARIFEENPTNGMQHGVTVRVESTQPAPTEGFDIAWEVRSMEGDDQVDSTSGDIDFSSGDSHKEFTLMITKDNTREAETPVTVRLSTPTSLPTGWNFGVQEYTFTIETSDSNVVFSDSTNATTTANEGDTLTFELVIETIVAPSTGLPINILTHEGNAGEDLRFEETVIIPAGQSRQSFTVEVIDDSTAEDAETYNIAISLGTNFPHSWGVVGGTRTITINPSDPATVSLNYSGGSTIGSSLDDARMTIELSKALSQDVTVNIVTTGSTAVYGVSNDWTMEYRNLPDGTTTPPFSWRRDAACTSFPCGIEITAGQTITEIRIITNVSSTVERTIVPSIQIPSASQNLVVLGSPSTHTLTIQ